MTDTVDTEKKRERKRERWGEKWRKLRKTRSEGVNLVSDGVVGKLVFDINEKLRCILWFRQSRIYRMLNLSTGEILVFNDGMLMDLATKT